MLKLPKNHNISDMLKNQQFKEIHYQILAEDHGRKPVGESVPLKQMKEIV